MTDDGIRYVPVAGTWLEETLARALVEAGILGAYVFPAGMATKIIATPAGQSLAARVAALEAAVPVDPFMVMYGGNCYSCGEPHRYRGDHAPDCRWLAVRGGASVHRDRADV
jgi:hypothetical protein